jgi:hypothetical protein
MSHQACPYLIFRMISRPRGIRAIALIIPVAAYIRCSEVSLVLLILIGPEVARRQVEVSGFSSQLASRHISLICSIVNSEIVRIRGSDALVLPRVSVQRLEPTSLLIVVKSLEHSRIITSGLKLFIVPAVVFMVVELSLV